ncbi:unnamed protein product [Toxocara canis]|uniref:Uncharacterized protein n=1 Tax=Toxocara canis TaxID=6265 RepID=A0A183VCP0_TOXCA|nr:unnamed protein product [Toxocara canis]
MTEVEVTRLPGIAKTDKVIILCIAVSSQFLTATTPISALLKNLFFLVFLSFLVLFFLFSCFAALSEKSAFARIEEAFYERTVPTSSRLCCRILRTCKKASVRTP